MGILLSRHPQQSSRILSTDETKERIKALIAELDHECHKVLHVDMKPVEIALLVIIHQKHSDEITFNASHQSWTWNRKSFQDEYKTRLNDVTQKDQQEETTKNFIKKAKMEVQNLDAIFDNLTDEGKSEVTVNNFLDRQRMVVSKMSVERANEAKEQITNFSESIDDVGRRKKYQEKIEELNEKYKNRMMDYLENQRQNISEVLDQYHKEQMDMIEAMDKELMKEVERRNCPSSKDLLEKVRVKGDPAMDDEKLKIIDEMTNNIMKADIDKTELSKLFSERLTRDKTLKVAVNLPHRPGASKENNEHFTHLIAKNYKNQPISIQSVMHKGSHTREAFLEAKNRAERL